ncbi:hypothetical protein N7532_011723 [Penicillium argentinense]|uniref:CNH domain-containing protein n=1 Tax=Penicillium argentinense TaxID=1131581 RepID=A0A9W9JV84_9EURO|nr:uncharacterized protein N7532_011723 [Penicillium argentinense]KAJ5082680.1 hypothetical protein N7532_011723 [Penicillium argentinense]
MASDDGVGPRKRRRTGPPGSEPYVLRSLFDSVPLTTESSSDVYITCVEYWGKLSTTRYVADIACEILADQFKTEENLYIGTSAAEILHFVSLPPASDDSNEPTFILASRLPIPFQSIPSDLDRQGVRQIVILASVNKACVLCNGTVTFYMLPELSPAFGNTKVHHCSWIGGLDLSRDEESGDNPVVMIAVQDRIMLVQIGEEARRIKSIKFPGCLVAARRGTIACAADTHSYSLLEVEYQQKIPLFPISSSSEVFESGRVEEIQQRPTPLKRSPSSSYPSSPPGDPHGHGRSSSLNTFVGMLQPHAQTPRHERSSSGTPDPFTSTGTPRRSSSEESEEDNSKQTDAENQEGDQQSTSPDSLKPLPPLPKQPVSKQLQPHVVSPTPSEFLLVTGTEEKEPGVGMFVDMDGEVVRGTINFHRYPKSVVIDSGEDDLALQPTEGSKEEFILALIKVGENDEQRTQLEIQRWDDDPAELERQKRWIDIPSSVATSSSTVGFQHTVSPSRLELDDVGKLLRMARFKSPVLPSYVPTADPRTQATIEQLQKEKELFETQELTDSETSKKGESGAARDWETQRNDEEAKFAHGLGKLQSSLILWSGSQIWRLVKNPLVIQLENALRMAQQTDASGHTLLRRSAIIDLMYSIQDVEPKTESEFIGLNYVKQKASLMLYGDLLSMHPDHRGDAVIQNTEQVILDGNLDPRLALLFIPLLRCEVLQGPQGIWIHAGLADIAEQYIQQVEKSSDQSTGPAAIHSAVLNMVKRFLFSWQQKRGYGSITDETYVLDSTDAALLHLLLEQDAQMEAEHRASSRIRTELNRLVDGWKGNFDRAVILLEQYQRLYILSRLYQSQKKSRNVLKTWRRIIDGEVDAGGEVSAASCEAQMRKYLVKIKDVQLVEEYGSWLARRNPGLGIQVFADNSSRVRLEPADVVKLLKERAPNAVQVYLEHLVFAKHYTQYADDLISYYLDEVLSVLEADPAARASLSDSYSTYRALRPPKPTYLNFITANTPKEPWWQSRLHLLQLLSGISGTQFSSTALPSGITYSITNVLERIEPFQNDLVSESIILDGLQGHHQAALRLLTHGLGDYDSAVRYCLFGGPRSSTSSGGAQPELADRALQSTLFRHLLDEFLHIEDLTDRIERTSDLLARFAAWFDVREVLDLVPEDWSVDILGGFFVHVFRALVSETREARIERALSAGLNLRIGVEYIDSMEKAGPWVEDGEGLRRLKDSGSQAPPDDATAGEDGDFGEVVGPLASGEIEQAIVRD